MSSILKLAPLEMYRLRALDAEFRFLGSRLENLVLKFLNDDPRSRELQRRIDTARSARDHAGEEAFRLRGLTAESHSLDVATGTFNPIAQAGARDRKSQPEKESKTMGLSFLKKAGQIIAAVTGIMPLFQPGLSAISPKIAGFADQGASELTKIGQVILQTEVIGNTLSLKGPDKLKAAAPQIAQLVMMSSLIAGKKISNPTLFSQGSAKIGDGMADILNSLHEDEANVIDVQDYKIS